MATNVEPVFGILPVTIALVLSYFVRPFVLVQTNPVSSAVSPAFSGLEIDIVVVIPIFAIVVDMNIIFAILIGSGSLRLFENIYNVIWLEAIDVAQRIGVITSIDENI